MWKQTNKWGVKEFTESFKHYYVLSSTRQSFAKKRHFHVEGQTLFEKPAQKLIVRYGSWSSFQSTFYSVKFNMKCKPNPAGARGKTWSRYFWLKYYLRIVECKELDTNYLQKWVSTDYPSTNLVDISSSKEELASDEEGSRTHLTPTANISKWQTSTSQSNHEYAK